MPANSNPTPPQDLSHIIQTTRDGYLDDVSPHAHVAEVIGRALASKQPLVIHLHGGLVPKESAYEQVNELQRRYLEEGFFPIFMVWRTGIFDALKNAEELVHRPVFARLLVRLLKYFVSKYELPGGKGKAVGTRDEPDNAQVQAELAKRNVGEIPYEHVKPDPDRADMSGAEQKDFLDSLQNDQRLQQDWEEEVEQPGAPSGAKSLAIDVDIRDEALKEKDPTKKSATIAVALAKHALRIAMRVTKRFFKHRDHGLHTTIVEEILRELYVDLIGTEVWQFMKKDSADTFEHDGEMPERGGWLLMRLLGEVIKQRTGANAALPKISIVGHSAGSIYASNLLTYLWNARESSTSSWYQSKFVIDKLVFLAPAATCTVFSAALKLHGQRPLFKAFRMFSMTDHDEHDYYEVPVLYPGSLLYIISGLLESEDDKSGDMPLVGMQRFARQAHPFEEPAVKEVWEFLHLNTDQLVWSGDNRGSGLNCDSKKHGAFYHTPKTVASILYFLK
jgi:hypothetical protein